MLIVAADADLTNPLRGELERRGWAMARAATGDDALEQVEQGPHDLVLIGLRAPGMPGEELIRRIRRYGDGVVARTPVMVYAPYAGAGEMALAFGADDYLTEPCVPSHVVARVASCAGRS